MTSGPGIEPGATVVGGKRSHYCAIPAPLYTEDRRPLQKDDWVNAIQWRVMGATALVYEQLAHKVKGDAIVTCRRENGRKKGEKLNSFWY